MLRANYLVSEITGFFDCGGFQIRNGAETVVQGRK